MFSLNEFQSDIMTPKIGSTTGDLTKIQKRKKRLVDQPAAPFVGSCLASWFLSVSLFLLMLLSPQFSARCLCLFTLDTRVPSLASRSSWYCSAWSSFKSWAFWSSLVERKWCYNVCNNYACASNKKEERKQGNEKRAKHEVIFIVLKFLYLNLMWKLLKQLNVKKIIITVDTTLEELKLIYFALKISTEDEKLYYTL